MKRVAAVAIVVGSGCLASCFLKPDRPGGAPADGHGADAPTSACMGSVVWGMPHQLTELAGVGSSQESAWLSKDKSELWFTAVRNAVPELWHSTRAGSGWGSAEQVLDLGNGFIYDPHVVISDDGLAAWYTTMQGSYNISTATRGSAGEHFVPQGWASFVTDNGGVNEVDAAINGNATVMVFGESIGGAGLPSDLMITDRPTPSDQWSTPTALGRFNTASDECCEALDETGTTLMFSSNVGGDYMIYVATRADRQSMFGSATLLPHQISGNDNSDPVLSRDGLTVIFSSSPDGHDHLYEMTGSCAQ
ncbi:MAG: hypothetical protein JO257_05400 [Deltaproteobacteria bacterium]|nr:hypothetical protein [Deltaproteobacteria bacterium]